MGHEKPLNVPSGAFPVCSVAIIRVHSRTAGLALCLTGGSMFRLKNGVRFLSLSVPLSPFVEAVPVETCSR